ncbi:hypothetical protein TVAG_304000 [Trichomonas vaginalis G3]|uniref:Uncharacterized protein n=1 Tax=Trichomonas vaginalis (strain ATCC PRA-98 / G3) TaxID=412133 RepID=A2G172_TRIV3|nr:hypothetical protein TVAGG3_0793540 [Trichomonas vaginalis G3]EAX89089.1 hypothetical protein TVAG_304000 [Trichomonas vaginalis G3]KAI5495990.1 hypothetical protein TVAGG3_0793540 [Trichomonas vaginalis G3]|eukprot:XP_001302019.1 hypothetical protein [Trichomonas vaginalis G3]
MLPVIPDVRARLAKKSVYSRNSATMIFDRQTLRDSTNCHSLSSYSGMTELPALKVKKSEVKLDIPTHEKKPRRSSYSQKYYNKKSNPYRDAENYVDPAFIKQAKKSIKGFYKNSYHSNNEDNDDSYIEIPGLPPPKAKSPELAPIQSESELTVLDIVL